MKTSHVEKKVTFVELFFDLVFVFSLTQVVSLLHHSLDWGAAARTALVFWLVWWAWTQYTWALNAADGSRPGIQIGVLLATATAFLMAVAVPEAFGDRSAWFALTYVLVRGIGLGLYRQAAAELPGLGPALRTFTLASLGGLIAVLAGGFAGGAAQIWLWALAIALDLLAAGMGGRLEGWNLIAGHFAERHGGFVIIALGETLIIAASGVADTGWSGELIVVAVLAVAATCALWWSYFRHAAGELEAGLAAAHGAEKSKMARDAYSVVHYVMLLGVIGFAAGLEEAIAHPSDPLHPPAALALGLGIGLFTVGMAAAIRRANGVFDFKRLIVGTATAAAIAFVQVDVPVSLAIAIAGLALIGVLEEKR